MMTNRQKNNIKNKPSEAVQHYKKIIAAMSPGKKLEVSFRLYDSAKELKRAALKNDFPLLPDKEIEKMLRDIFLYARS